MQERTEAFALSCFGVKSVFGRVFPQREHAGIAAPLLLSLPNDADVLSEIVWRALNIIQEII